MKSATSLAPLAVLAAVLLAAPAAKSQTRSDAPSPAAPGGSWSVTGTPPSTPAPAPTSATASISYVPAGAPLPASPAAPAPAAPAPSAPAAAPPPDEGRPQWATPRSDRLVDQKFLHGFRLGYAYVANSERPIDSLGGHSLKERIDMKTPHSFLLGYEGMTRMVGHSWLNVILVGNVIVAGLEQSKVYPTANGLLGFEIDNSFQLGVGASVTPLKGQEAHAIVAGGWTPRAGSFYVPVHAFFIPDVEGLHRTGVTTGVTW